MKKQIILILTDTTRYDMLGCYGNKDMKTPSLDALAAEGVRFNRAYTCQPVCGPAKSAIFTGQYPHSNGAWTNSLPLGANVKTLGQRLSDNGVYTAFIGKWHLDGGDYFGTGRCPEGWDAAYWYDMRNYLEELTEEERFISRFFHACEEEFTYAHRCSDKAMDFLSKHHDEDFFLTLSLDEPHHPYLCPEPYASMYDGYTPPRKENLSDTLENKPAHQRVWAGKALYADRSRVTGAHPQLFGCNSYADYEIGRVLRAAREYAPEAMIIYTTDHGDALGSHCIDNKGPAVYDEIVRVPLIIKSPAARENAVYESPVSHIDIAPTVMEYMGLSVPKLFEGKSLLPALKDPAIRVNGEVFIEFGRYEIDHDGFGGFQPLRAVFDGRYKLAIHLLSGDELYDLDTDPEEMNNLILNEDYKAIRNSLHDRLLGWMNETRDPFRGYYWETRPWREDAREPSWDYTGYTRQREHEEYEPRQLNYSTGLEMEISVRRKL